MRIYAYNIINKVGKDVVIMRETRILEFKETITNTFLKTVSAFSNYDGGTILFGVDDDGNVKGLPDVKQACLDICPLVADLYRDFRSSYLDVTYSVRMSKKAQEYIFFSDNIELPDIIELR